jgi:acetyl-CoA carboxylase biotin carboxyl carrier protein
VSETRIVSEVTGSVWKIEAAVGARVSAGDTLLILESMKMEIPVEAPCPGQLASIHVEEGEQIKEGQLLATVDG